MANGIAGNDTEQGRRDLHTQYGEHDTAEGLILAHDRSMDKLLRAALEKPVDADATEALDVTKIEPKWGGEVKAAAVRGGRLVVVEEVNGKLMKWHEEHKATPVAQQAAKQAAAGVGGPSSDDGVAEPGTGTDGTGTSPTAPDTAPEAVKVEAIRDKLGELNVSIPSDVRKKDALWALVPGEAREALQADAAAAAAAS